jgi:hypothetical protein
MALAPKLRRNGVPFLAITNSDDEVGGCSEYVLCSCAHSRAGHVSLAGESDLRLLPVHADQFAWCGLADNYAAMTAGKFCRLESCTRRVARTSFNKKRSLLSSLETWYVMYIVYWNSYAVAMICWIVSFVPARPAIVGTPASSSTHARHRSAFWVVGHMRWR